MIVTEKSRSMSIESGNDGHGVQSNAEHGQFHRSRHRPFLRIGQWPARTTLALAGPFIALESHIAIRRTGTDLENEETNIGAVRSRTISDNIMQSETEAARISHPHDTSSVETSVQSNNSGPNLSLDYYQFEWFRILIGMVLLMVSEDILLALVAVALTTNVVTLWLSFLISVAVGLFSLLLYVSIFVVLMEYHEAIEKFLDKHAHLWPRLQHTCLRASAYIYACGVIAVICSLNVTFWLMQ